MSSIAFDLEAYIQGGAESTSCPENLDFEPQHELSCGTIQRGLQKPYYVVYGARITVLQ